MSSAFLFDVGNVIVTIDFMKGVQRIASQAAVPAEEILPRLAPLTAELQLGQISLETFFEGVRERIGYSGTSEEFCEAFGDIFTLNEPIAALIESLKNEGAALYLLSNTNVIHARYLSEHFPIFRLFDGAIYSYEVGLTKPSLTIFDQAKTALSLQAERTIYLDDALENCEAAKAAGFLAVHYTVARHDEALREIEALRRGGAV